MVRETLAASTAREASLDIAPALEDQDLVVPQEAQVAPKVPGDLLAQPYLRRVRSVKTRLTRRNNRP